MRCMQAVHVVISLVMASLFPPDCLAAPVTGTAGRVTVRVRETAGIRRFGYPVAVRIELDPPANAAAKFRITHLGKPVTAQFRPIEQRDGRISAVALDFDSNFMPHELRE